MATALAIDIGGTKMVAGLVSDGGAVLAQTRAATPAGADADTLFATVSALAREMLGADVASPEVCGVGCGGPMTGGGRTVSPVNIGGWRDFPLLERLSDVTGLATFVDNDAKALALGEGWMGAASGVANFIAMVVSTGVGGGLVLDGRMLDGEQGNAGHIGHVNVVPDGRRCGCGAFGCLEAEASGTAIAAATGAPPAEADQLVRERTGTLVGRAVASVANLLDLRLAVVAGSVALGFGEPFFRAAQEEINRRARLEFSRSTRIAPAGLGAQGPLIGAAALAWRGTGREMLR